MIMGLTKKERRFKNILLISSFVLAFCVYLFDRFIYIHFSDNVGLLVLLSIIIGIINGKFFYCKKLIFIIPTIVIVLSFFLGVIKIGLK